MAFADSLICRECSRTSPFSPTYFCEWCFGPLEVLYDYEAVAASISREKIAAEPVTGANLAAELHALSEPAHQLQGTS